jgi:hypothetical protein
MEEIWNDVPNYEGIYQVSNLGRVKSLERTISRAGKYDVVIKERFLKLGTDSHGYLIASLHKDLKAKTFKVHKLLAIVFLKHKPCGYNVVIDHIDNNKLNNNLENLQLITHRQNISKDKKNKTSKYTGVCWHKHKKKWLASIQVNKVNLYLGMFTNEYDAYLAYQNKLKEISVL